MDNTACNHKPTVYRPIIIRNLFGTNNARICKYCGEEIKVKNYDRFMKPLRIVRICCELLLVLAWVFVIVMSNRPILSFFLLKPYYLTVMIAFFEN